MTHRSKPNFDNVFTYHNLQLVKTAIAHIVVLAFANDTTTRPLA